MTSRTCAASAHLLPPPPPPGLPCTTINDLRNLHGNPCTHYARRHSLQEKARKAAEDKEREERERREREAAERAKAGGKKATPAPKR